MTVKQKDLVLGLALLVTVAAFAMQSLHLEYPANVFPWSLEALLAVFALVVLVQAARRRDAAPRSGEAVQVGRIIGILVASIVYLIVIPLLGFYTTSFLFMTLISWLVGERRDLRGLLNGAVVGVLLVGVVYAGFWLFLKVPTPSGILF